MTVHWDPLLFRFSRLPHALNAGAKQTRLEHGIAGDSGLIRGPVCSVAPEGMSQSSRGKPRPSQCLIHPFPQAP